MLSLLARGKRKATGRHPSNGEMRGLINETAKNGWHYQVEWIYDTRIHSRPHIIVYAFKPKHDGNASHYLRLN